MQLTTPDSRFPLSLSALGWPKSLSRYIAISLAVMAFLSAVSTYILLSSVESPLNATPQQVGILITVNVLLLLALAVVVGKQVVTIWRTLHDARRTRLLRRLVMAFSFLAIGPGVVVSVLAGYLFYGGIQIWFDTKVRMALEESVAVAEAYVEEHRNTIRADALAIAGDIDRQAQILRANTQLFNRFLTGQSNLRGVTELIVFQPDKMIARSSLSFAFTFEKLPIEAMQQAANGDVVILSSETEDRVRALVGLDSVVNGFLLVGRFIDPKVLSHLDRSRGGMAQYQELQQHITKLRWQFFGIFVLVTLLLLLAALWVGLHLAGRLLGPIGQLASAAERIRSGDFSARVHGGRSDDELGELADAFNSMTTELGHQRKALVEVNRQLDDRRRFIENVLAGVSAGVIALDKAQCIMLMNRPAEKLLQIGEKQVGGTKLATLLPEMAALLEQVQAEPSETVQGDVTLEREGETPLTLHVRVAADMQDVMLEGYIVTFDDITRLVQAQRHAAWADVARRVAHEIKNPLTPIQLSAERLKRKYGNKLEEPKESELFDKYVGTIVRHVGDIRAMVEEFVTFARMPAPDMHETNLRDVVSQATFSEQGRAGDIRFTKQVPENKITRRCDAGQIGRALGNLLKNAAEVLHEQGTAEPSITVSLREHGGECHITVEDNGPGFPQELMAQLTEPYVTTRSRGTGLGLAIVRKIMEDHGGRLVLENSRTGGARAVMVLPA